MYLVSDQVKEVKQWDVKKGIEDTFWDPMPMPPPLPDDSSPVPYHTNYITGYWVPPSFLHWDGEQPPGVAPKTPPPPGKQNIYWINGSVYLVFPETPGANNVWHWGISIMNLWTAQFQNFSRVHSSPHVGPLYPPMDYAVVLGDTNIFGSWHYGMLDMVTQDHTKKLFFENLWIGGKPINEGRGPQGRPNFEVEENTLFCAKQAVMVGYKPALSGGVAEAQHFREKVYKYFDIKLEEPQKKVLLVDRLEFMDRRWLNEKHFYRIFDDYGLPYQYIDDPSRHSFEQQVRAFASSGVTIIPHGAGMPNIMFQQPRSSVIEIFPYQGFQTMYR